MHFKSEIPDKKILDIGCCTESLEIGITRQLCLVPKALVGLTIVTGFWKTYHLHTSEKITLHHCDSKLQAYQIYFCNNFGNWRYSYYFTKDVIQL